MAFFMKDDVPNGISKILIPFDGVINWNVVLKSNSRVKGDHATHL
jgi:hypothetical protein